MTLSKETRLSELEQVKGFFVTFRVSSPFRVVLLYPKNAASANAANYKQSLSSFLYFSYVKYQIVFQTQNSKLKTQTRKFMRKSSWVKILSLFQWRAVALSNWIVSMDLKLGEFAFKWLQKFTGVPGKKSIFFCFNFTRRILRYNKTFLRVSE